MDRGTGCHPVPKTHKKAESKDSAFLTGTTGFEPVSTVLETAALPLNYVPSRSPSNFIINDS